MKFDEINVQDDILDIIKEKLGLGLSVAEAVVESSLEYDIPVSELYESIGNMSSTKSHTTMMPGLQAK